MDGTTDRPSLRTAMDGAVWRITLDRPDTGNAVDPALAAQLRATLLDRPQSARVLLLDAAGPRFCVGGDVRGFGAAVDPGTFIGQLARDWHQAVRALLALDVPVIAAVHGAVAGAGVGLLGACDIVVCARSTTIRPAYLGIGLSPDGGTSWALTHALGLSRALDLVLTDRALTAAQAHEAGLVARLEEDEALADTALALARQLADGPVRAMVRSRALLRAAATAPLDAHLDDEARQIAESADVAEGREGVAAFLGRRPPDFTQGWAGR